MITSLLIFNTKGDVLMSKFYKEGVKKNVTDVFRIQVINAAGKVASSTSVVHANRSPVLTLGSTSFLYIRSGSLWLVAVARSNQDSSLIFEFLHHLLRLLEQLFARGNDQLCEDDITGNFTMIFDILGEVVEFGYPTSMEPSYLASIIPGFSSLKTSHKIGDFSSTKKSFLDKSDQLNSIDSAYDSSTVSWREQGIKYRKNEIFLNVDEKITLLLDARGNHLRSHIDGKITLRSQLSGMPVCRFGLSDDHFRDATQSIKVEDFNFHKCVDLAKYASEKVIRFVPPDGTFQLMSYRISDTFALPFDIIPQVIEDDNSISLKIRMSSNFSSKAAATGVVLKITIPQGVTKKATSCSNGKAKFDAQENAILWKFSKFYGESEHLLSVDFQVPAATTGWFKPKITLDFNMDTHSASGLQVKFLKVVEKSNYRTVKWVKYGTHAGSYEIRL
ncbi:hypothetical protein JCM33374_g2824 [Metschnikowia sp. JCM 33374]|nr:hypothetical protein JCM33374_g2824 [Metschnikowia sp. JCM 33374]